MAALATRYVRIAIEPGFAARFRDAGNDAGAEFARAFKLRVQAVLSGFNPKVKVQLDWDNFRPPPMPPINLRVGFDMTSAIQAGRRAAQVANAAAGSINLNVNGSGLGSIVNNFINSGIQQISQQFGNITNNASSAANSVSSFGSSLSSLGGSISQAFGIAKVAFIIASLPAIAMAATAALYALGGALGSLPAVSVGLGFSVGALSLGFMGLGDHLKSLPKAGGGAGKSMSALHNAMRSVTRAQRDLTKATLDITKARADEIERIDDLSRALRGARLDEEDAVAAVAEARTKLAEARASGDVNAIGEADRAYRRSLLTLDEARDKTGDLAAEKEKADKDGVEGSDQVQKALERQRDAVDALTAAQEALAEAQKSGGGGGMAQHLMAIAPAAQEVVDKLKQLKPVFDEIRLATQQSLFQGVAGELQKLSDTWKAPLKATLTSYASTFNGLFKNLSASVRQPEFVKDISSAAETVRTNIDKIGKAITGPLVAAFGTLAQAAKPFIDTLGDKIAGMVEHFSAWIDSASKSGDLQKFFQDAAYYLGLIWDIGGNVIGLLGDIFGIIFDTKTQGGTKPWLEGFNEQLLMLREWLKDPENQKKIREFIDHLGELVAKGEEFTIWMTEKGLPALGKLIEAFSWLKDKIEEGKKKLDEYMDRWKKVRDALSAPLSIPQTIFDGVITAMKWAIDRAVDLFNSLHLGIKIGAGSSGIDVSGSARQLPTANKPRPFASGGVVRATPGGTFAQVAEAGKDEAVAPIDVLQGYVEAAVAKANADNGGHGETVIQLFMFPGAAEYDRFVIGAAERNKGAIAKIVNGGNKRIAYAD